MQVPKLTDILIGKPSTTFGQKIRGLYLLRNGFLAYYDTDTSNLLSEIRCEIEFLSEITISISANSVYLLNDIPYFLRIRESTYKNIIYIILEPV